MFYELYSQIKWIKSNLTLCLFSFVLKVKISTVTDTVSYIFKSLTDSCHAKKAQIVFVFFNGSDSHQISYSTGSRTAAGVGRYLFYLLFTANVYCLKVPTVYDVINCNRCSMFKAQFTSEIPLYLPCCLTPCKPPLTPKALVSFWCVISDIPFYRVNHMELQVFNYFWPPKISFILLKLIDTQVKNSFFKL